MENNIEAKPLVRYKGKIVKIEGEKAIASLKEVNDPKGLERNIALQLSEIKAKSPIECGNLVYVDILRERTGKISIKEEKYIVYH